MTPPRQTFFKRLPAVALASAMLWSAAPGGATPTVPPPDLYRITGHVRDPIGRGIGGGVVVANRVQCNPATDPDQCLARQSLTDSAGYYEIPESSTGRFYLVVTKPGGEGASRVLDVVVFVPDPVADLTMRYLVSGALDRTALSTASAQAQTTFRITSYAPLPGLPAQTGGRSCVKVTDSRTPGAPPADATYVAPASGGAFSWTYPLTVPQSSTEGSYSLSAWAEDCSSGVHLSTTGIASYVVDNTPPEVVFLTPMDRSNTAFDGPLAAMVVDRGLAGVDPAGASITLIQGSSTTTRAAPWNAANNWAKTPDVPLSQGLTYRLSASAADLAGNVGQAAQAPESEGGGFRRITATPTHATAEIPRTSCTIVTQDVLSGTQQVRCDNVPLRIGLPAPDSGEETGSEVELSATTHGGVATLVHTVDLAQAVLVDPLLPSVNRQGNNTSWGKVSEQFQFQVPGSATAPVTYALPGRSVTIPTLSATVPINWSGAAVEMDSWAAPAMDACADPSGTITCVPDPVRYMPPIGTPLDRYDARGLLGATFSSGYVRAPAVAAAPDWFDADFEAQLRAAGGAALPIPDPNDFPLPSEIGIRPGTWWVELAPVPPENPLSIPYRQSCTLNFVFEDSAGKKALGTAGHCINNLGDSVAVLTLDPSNPSLELIRPVGTTIYKRWLGTSGPTEDDFGLIEIDPGAEDWVSPTAAFIGGPCGTYAGSRTPMTLFHVGHGTLVGTGGTPRAASMPTPAFWQERTLYYIGTFFGGDSGSPVRAEPDPVLAPEVSPKAAVGIFTALRRTVPGWFPPYPPLEGPPIFSGGPKIDYIQSLLANDPEQSARGWRLLDSPLCTLP